MIELLKRIWKRWNIGDRIIPYKTSFEYSPIWQSKTRPKCLSMCPLCCLYPWRRAAVVHHLKYKRSRARIILGYLFLGHDFGASVSGYEIPGWDIVSISKDGHENSYGASLSPKSVHFTGTKPHWIKHKNSIDNHQSTGMMLRLRLTFLFIIGGWLIVIFPVVAATSYLVVSLIK